MDTLVTKQAPVKNQRAISSSIFQVALKLVNWLEGFFVLTKDDLRDAGIDLGNDQQDDGSG